jgi:iron complex outermembrane receptor protein
MIATQCRKFLLCSTMMAGIAAASPAVAQDAGTATAPQAEDGENYDEIVVTGDRANRFGTDTVQSGSFRNAKVIDVPLTISVIPAEVLKSQQAVDLIDAVRNTAGVSTTGTGPVAYNNLTIRGIAVDTRANFRLDGALNMLSATAFPLENKDRVEVLKGASALYYGFSSPAGIVNLTMKRATPDFSVFANVFGDVNGGYGAHLDVGDTLGVFGYRLNGVAAHLDTGIDYAKGDRYVASGTFDFKPTDRLTITTDVEYFEKSIVEPALFLLTIPNGATTANIPDVDLVDPRVNFAGADWDSNRTHELNLLAKAVYEFADDWDLTAYWGRSRMSRKRNNPQFTPRNLGAALDPNDPTYGAGTVRFSAQQAEFENINYAAEIAGTIHFGGNIKNEVLLGVSRSIRSLASSPNIRTTFNQNFANPVFISDPNLVYSALPPISKVDDKGIYLFNRLNFDDIVQVLAGIRKSDYSNDGSINAVTKTPYTAKPTSYSLGLMLKPKEWVSLYGTYIEGLEETPAAPSTTDNATEVFPPTNSKQYEAGIKIQPKPDLLIQMAYFKIDRGAAYAANLPGTTTLHFYTDGREVYEGGELSVTGYVTPDLALYATATLLSAHYRGQPGIAGNRVDGTPNRTWSLAGEYRPSWLDPNLKVTAGMYHTGTQALNANNVAFTDSFTTYDLGASYSFNIGDHQLVARVNGQNITGKRYWASVGGNSLAPALPGTVKLSLSFQY